MDGSNGSVSQRKEKESRGNITYVQDSFKLGASLIDIAGGAARGTVLEEPVVDG